MKWLIFITFGALLGAITATAALADDYEQSEQYQTVKAANAKLKQIREGEL